MQVCTPCTNPWCSQWLLWVWCGYLVDCKSTCILSRHNLELQPLTETATFCHTHTPCHTATSNLIN